MTVTAQQVLERQLHAEPSDHSLLGSRPLVIFSQPEVSRTCEVAQHLVHQRVCMGHMFNFQVTESDIAPPPIMCKVSNFMCIIQNKFIIGIIM